MSLQPDELAEAVQEASLNGHEEAAEPADGPAPSQPGKSKKKRKKKPSSAAGKEVALAIPQRSLSDLNNVLISRSKHLKYISSYHGNWLNLPPGIVETLLECNEEARVDYRRLASEERRLFQAVLSEMGTEKQAVTARAAAKAPSRVEYSKWRDLLSGPTAFDYAASTGQRMPPAVDKSAMRNVMEVRRLVDGATDLLTRAASGMTAAELKAMNDPYDGGGGLLSGKEPQGRSSGISSVRQARLRGMAISQLAQAFRIDEIATSVILMQVATPFEEAATKVLRADPTNLDAAYVLYYQERIPSRTLCMSTPPDILDRLVNSYQINHPHLPAMYRSRGILNLYRQDFAAAVRDFDEGLRICKLQSARKTAPRTESRHRGSGTKKKGRLRKSDVVVAEAETPVETEEELFDIGHAPGDDVVRQMFFSRGMTYFMWASDLIEREILGLVDVTVPQDGLSNEGGELSLEGAGLKTILGSLGLYDESTGTARRFREALTANSAVVQKVDELLRQCLQDHQMFQAYFPTLEVPPGHVNIDSKQEADDIAHAARSSGIDRSISFRGRRLVHARALTGRLKVGEPREDGSNADTRLYTSYHPMLGESVFTQLLAQLLLGNFEDVLRSHYRATRMMAGLDTALDGRPFFLLGRSLSQSEYHEVLERLSHNWLRGRPGLANGNIPLEGALASLAHVTAFFTPEHEQKLFDIYLKHEEEGDKIREQTREVHPEAHKLLNLLDGKPSNGNTNKPAQPTKQHGYGSQTTARSEIALTWLLAARIAPLEAEEQVKLPLVSFGQGEGGSKSKGKGKARE